MISGGTREHGVTTLIVSYNTRALLLQAIASVIHVGPVVVCDNASADGSAEAVASTFPSCTVIASPFNLGFAAGVNRAAKEARTEFLLLLNPDAMVSCTAIDALVRLLREHRSVAAVSPALTYSNGGYQPSAFAFPGLAQVALDLFPIPRMANSPANGRYQDLSMPRRVDTVLGACMLVRRAAWDDVGPFDEGYFMYVEEIDWCRRAWARNWEIWHEPRVSAIHHAGQSTRQQSDRMYAQLWRSRLRYYQRHSPMHFQLILYAVARLGLLRAERCTRREVRGDDLQTRLRFIRQVRALIP